MTATVVGGGLAGLVAARELAIAGHDVVLHEAGDRLGGQLLTDERWGDVGAEAFLVRRPEVLQLALALGLAGEVVHPAPQARPQLLIEGRLRPLPAGTVMGVPTRLRQLRGVVSPGGLLRAALDPVLPHRPFDGDVTVGGAVRTRLGEQVALRLVDPLLGGVYGGSADALSLAATVPDLQGGRSLVRRARRASGPAAAGPIFGSLREGLGSLVTALAADLAARGVQVRLGSSVTALEPERGPVVVAAPGAAAVRLLAPFAAQAATAAAATPWSEVAVVTLVWPRAGAGLLAEPTRSGWLVPRDRHRLVKAVTLMTSKWPHLRERWPDHVVVRASIGRHGDDLGAFDDRHLTGVAAAEVSHDAGAHGRLEHAQVTRWVPALPQYLVGHLDRVARARAALPHGVAVAGSTWDGVGLPAIVASARRAAAQAADWSP